MALTGWWGCSTEVDLTAPYDSIPVVYGLLEVDADTQWVKINRTWLGDGNQLVAAQIPDSSEYPEGSVTAKIVELIPSESGEIVGNELATGVEWMLQDTVLENKSTDGIFFGPSQRVYFASMSERALREDRWYRLEALLPDGSELKATTTMVQSSAGSIERPPPNLSSYQMGFASVNPDGSATYPSFPFRWTSAPGASRYAASLKVNFQERYYADDELTLLDSVRDRTISLSLGNTAVEQPQQHPNVGRKLQRRNAFTVSWPHVWRSIRASVASLVTTTAKPKSSVLWTLNFKWPTKTLPSTSMSMSRPTALSRNGRFGPMCKEALDCGRHAPRLACTTSVTSSKPCSTCKKAT